MNLLIALFVSKSLRNISNPKKVGKRIRKEAKFFVQLITEIVQLIYNIFKFVTRKVKHIRKGNTVPEAKPQANVIDFAEYKLKKAN